MISRRPTSSSTDGKSMRILVFAADYFYADVLVSFARLRRISGTRGSSHVIVEFSRSGI